MTQPTKQTWQTVNRIVYPVEQAHLITPLYVAEWTQPRIPASALDIRNATRSANIPAMSREQVSDLIRESSPAPTASSSFRIDGRTRLHVRPGGHVSLCTYFNAFPASYWRYWTGARKARFTASVRGKGSVIFFTSTARGLSRQVAERTFPTPLQRTSGRKTPSSAAAFLKHGTSFDQDLPIDDMMDGGYVWCDIQADPTGDGLDLRDAAWQVLAPGPGDTRPGDDRDLSIVITTFNRAEYCFRQLRMLAGARELRKHLRTIYCIDQGTRPLSGYRQFTTVSERLGDQLTYVRQDNLGGTGGFTRGMVEALKASKAGESGYVLLLDDDAIIEPEALLRSLQFAQHARRPVIVGAGMLHLDDRTMLYTQAERMNMGTLLHEQYVTNHDFAVSPLRESPELHRRVDSQYNGWWMCLIPLTVIRSIGLPFPSFIKFDDIEYGYRATEHGFPVVSLPGVAIWHQAWHSKDETRSWQEYFNQRNRWIFALLHERTAPRRLPLMISRHLASMGLRFNYSGLAMDILALQDVLAGPARLVTSYRGKLAQVRRLRDSFPDTRKLPEGTEPGDAQDALARLPQPRVAFATPQSRILSSRQVLLGSVGSTLRALVRPRSGEKEDRPDVWVDSEDSDWQAYQHALSALVAAPDGRSVSWLRRDDRLFRHQFQEALRLTHRLVRDWPRLHHAYRAAGLGSVGTWDRILTSDATGSAASSHDSR